MLSTGYSNINELSLCQRVSNFVSSGCGFCCIEPYMECFIKFPRLNFAIVIIMLSGSFFIGFDLMKNCKEKCEPYPKFCRYSSETCDIASGFVLLFFTFGVIHAVMGCFVLREKMEEITPPIGERTPLIV